MVKIKNKQADTFDKLHQALHNLVNRHKTLDRTPRDFGISELLIGSEVHTISVVGENSMSNISELAKKLGVTKAAASQSIGNLQKKGYLKKLRDDNNKREVLLVLTEKGNKVYKGHRSVWRKSCSKFLYDVTDEQIDAFIQVADRISASADSQVDENT
ncbi:MarR family winged helix-turn-helix transcriptional regulator [Thermodesulfobacteriota bacterium]